ncbi:MBL fold metallo-hydrolase [Sphingobacterium psychroaquaticum]|uniref:Phosphoribosyl 1,2-cyclic phosphodiesterase n=1 Tax=Sphingobacterium psychroaquaticum TaxID=561061 RepID=A0A1X7KID3_9SPHI|nr:MBL fold metallo-hydrolase [Sphingobacterium psychroaquaticum]SMG40810.1 Phosphoribosyl 1,2-cyclic phosphodiesterase [Sphingobacterium psychroaquaticum]
MKYCALASGSNGNCYYIADGDDAILVDVGINTKHVLLRMAAIGVDPASVKAIFITHEHTDHIRGLSVFCKRYAIPVYITAGSYKGSRLHLPEDLVHIIAPNAQVVIGKLTVYGVPKYHDAKEPCSFLISNGVLNIGVLTDIGRACDNVKQVIQHSDILLLEANYDENMLNYGRYSYYLKNRIKSGWGHISNTEALEAFMASRSPRLRHLMLTHLSGENNEVELVRETFAPYCEDIQLSVATRYQETPLFDTEGAVDETSSVTIETEIVVLETVFSFSFITTDLSS